MNRLANGSALVQFRFRSRLPFGLLLAAAACCWPSAAKAISPDNPEVKNTIEKGLKYLDTAADGRLGAQALVGLCYHQAWRRRDESADAKGRRMLAKPPRVDPAVCKATRISTAPAWRSCFCAN